MKKLLFSVIAFALITTSCNKYKDDFKALNARIDALAATVAGVPALTTSIAAIQATLAAIQTSTNQIPGLATSLTALAAQVTSVQTSLATLAANVATQANLNSLFAQLNTTLTANQTAILGAIGQLSTDLGAAVTSINGNTNTAVANAVTALQTAITDAQTNINATTAAAIDAAVTQLLDAITTASGGTNALIAQLSTDLVNDVAILLNAINLNGGAIANVQAAVDALAIQLAVAAAQIQTLLNSNNIFLGDLIITNEAELVFAEGLGAKVRVITGNLTINTTLFDAGQMTRLKQVTNGDQVAPLTAYIGSVVGDVVLGGGNVIDLANLVSIGGASGNLTVSGASHILSGLLSVKGNYTATSNPVDDALITVGGAMTINYAGGYSYPNLTTVGTPAGASVLTANSAGGGSPLSITTISFPVLTTNNVLNDGVNANGVLVYGSATSVNIGASKTLTSLSAPASSVILGETAYTGPLTIVTGVVSTIDLSKMVSAVGAISISTATSASSTVDFSNFTGNGANTITVTGPRVLTMPKYLGALAGQLLVSTTVQTANLALYRGPNDLGGLSILQNLTVGDLRNTLGTGGATVATTLVTATVTGSTYGANVNFTGYGALTTVSTTGTPYMRSLTLDGDGALTSLTTTGQMDYFTLNNCDALGGLTMGHNFVNNALGNGTTVIVTGNASLATLTTSTSNMKELTVTGNGSLTTANFASYVVGQTITSGVVTMVVHSNAMTGTYTNSIFATNTAPVMTQASLSTLKAYATDILTNPVFAGSILNLGYTAGSESIVLMDADRAAFILAGGSGATTFVNRDLDADGGAGSRIGVVRELGYLL